MTITLTQFERTFIERYVAKQASQGNIAAQILSQMGIHQPIREWASNASAWVWAYSNSGFMGLDDYENAKEIGKVPNEKTAVLMSLAGQLVLSPTELAQARENSLGIQIGLQEIVSAHLLDFERQREGMIFNGDTSRYQAVGDPLGKARTLTVKPGMLNGTNGTHYTLITGGTGGDEGMANFGDFLDTCYRFIETAAPEGINTEKVSVVMDVPTATAFRKRRSAVDVSEFAIAKGEFPGWSFFQTDAILEKEADDVYTDMHKMAFIAPFDNNGEALLKYYTSKDLHVEPLYGGAPGPMGKSYWVVGWKGAPLAKNEHCVMCTGALNLAG